MKLGPLLRGVGGLAAGIGGAVAWKVLGAEAWLWMHLIPQWDDTMTYAEMRAAQGLFDMTTSVVESGYGLSLVFALLVMPAGYLVRVLARARTRAGYPDPFAGLRNWAKRRPMLLQLLLLIGPALWVLGATNHMRPIADNATVSWLAFAAPAGLVLAAQFALLQRGFRALASATVNEDEIAAEDRNADGLTFRAVAVTRETRAAVGGLGILSLLMLVASYWLPVTVLARSPIFGTALLAYLVVAVGGAVLFVRASRINVGLDGVYISGTARAKFVPYSEIDRVELVASSIDLMHGDRRVLRLQLHGEDALRRHAMADRIRNAIALATKQHDEPAVAFVKSADVERIERAASGAANYREVTPSREKLWEVLESPAVDAKGRAAAATALVKSSDEEERARLRSAAEKCAEPTVRARIAELLEDFEELEEHETAPGRALR